MPRPRKSSPPFHHGSSPIVLTLLSLLIVAGTCHGDWPTYRADATRSGYTAAPLPASLRLAWSFDAGTPEPAWPRSGRLPFDRAFHAVLTGGAVYFGHSGDHAVYRLDVATGQGEPIYTADGPIRFAPTVWRDRLFVVSDDGLLVCMDLDGKVLWKHRGGLDDSLRLGNEKLISKWPARGAPVVVDDVVYYAAGIWPTDEIFVYALDAATGDPVWTNDDSGGLYMSQPHGGAEAESGVSAQGYLVVSGTDATNVPFPGPAGSSVQSDATKHDAADQEDEPLQGPRLLLPTGRAVPASFDLTTGDFDYFHLQQYGKRGGFATMAVGPMFFNSGIAFDAVTGQAGETLGDGPIVAVPGGLIRSTREQVIAYRWVQQKKADRRGNQSVVWALQPDWTMSGVDGGTSLIVADQTVVAGGDGSVTLLDRARGKVLQRHEVDGNVYGLAAADGRLVVSTDAGKLVGFDARGDAASKENPAADRRGEPLIHRRPEPQSQWPSDPDVAEAAEEILSETGLREGYCLDFACGDGHLAYELARRSNLQIYAVDDDLAAVREARRLLRAAGLYGTRVTVHHVQDLSRLPHPRYFANLVVSRRSLTGATTADASKTNPTNADSGTDAPVADGWQDALRPYGGVARFGLPGEMNETVRGALEGAGQWTHQYASATNELCSTDERLQGPLGMLWYRDIDLDVPQRHGRAPSPLFYDGLLYHEGIDELVCVDAYNGRVVWRYDLPGILKAYDGDELMGVSGTGSNYCIGESGVYVRRDDHCLRLDRKTGERLGTFPAPAEADGGPGVWGYIAVEGDRLYGSLADRGHQVTYRYRATSGDLSQQLTESRTFFALDAKTGELKWRYDANDSIRHNAIAVDEDRVFLIDRPQATFDRTRDGKAERHPPGVLLALDSETGRIRWENDDEIDGTMLAVSPEHRRLLMSYQPTRFALASEIGGKLSVFSTEDGEVTWQRPARYSSRPLINDYTVYAQGGAWDLFSGEEQPFEFSRSYGCGILAGSRHMMVYRSATLGYQDLLGEGGTENYGGMRPGCWINAIPAGGLVLVPDASAGCTCSYLNQSWIALEPLGVSPPTMEPAGGSFSEPVEVRLSHHQPDGVVRYTLDGSAPRSSSPRYRQPLVVDASSQLRARYFSDDGSLSRTTDGEFVVDPHALPLRDDAWRVWDGADNPSSAPSNWSFAAGTITQSSNIFMGSASATDPEIERYGTLNIYRSGDAFGDGTIELEIRSADDDPPRRRLELRSIDTSRVGSTMPDSSAAMDIDGDGQVEIFSSMQNRDGHPEVLLYKRNSEGEWDRTIVGVVTRHKEEMEWVAVGRPFPNDSRFCVAASVQHKKDGLVVFRLREPGATPFDPANWEQGVGKGFAGQGLAFRDLTGDGVDELIYCTQAGNELGVLKVEEGGDPMTKSGWKDHVIDTGNKRSWWWLDGKFYDLNNNGFKNDFFVSTRRYGGSDLGMWKVIQTEPNDLSSYQVEKIYDGDAMNFDTGFFFSTDRDRKPDIVMLSKDENFLCLMDGRKEYAVTPIPFEGIPWNVKILPFLSDPNSRDAFVLATANSPSLFWSYEWRNGAYEIWKETGHAGNYRHPMDGTFTIADVDGDGETECIVPDSSPSKQSKGLAYLKAMPATDEDDIEPFARFRLDDGEPIHE